MPQPVHVRLEKYAAAASVASLASVGAADVIYRQVDQFVAADHYFDINVVTGATDSGIGTIWSGDDSTTNWTSHGLRFGWTVYPAEHNLLRAQAWLGLDITSSGVGAAALNFGDAVNPVATYSYAVLRSDDAGYGTWQYDEVKFLGFSVEGEDGERVFGWAQLELTAAAGIHIIDYAYDNTGAPITAGQGLPAGAAVPGAGGLAALACGAAGFRRRRTRVTTA